MERRSHRIFIPVLIVLLSNFTLWAGTYYEDGQVHNVYSAVNGPVMIDFQKPGMGTTVNWYNGASVVNFIRLHVAVYKNATFNMYGGKIAQILYFFDNTKGNIYGGQIGSGVTDMLDVGLDSIVNIYNGVINGNLCAYNRSQVTVYDGLIKNRVKMDQKAHLTIEGGEFGGVFSVGYFQTDTAVLTIKGNNFMINGQSVGCGAYYASDFASGTITGVLSNGDSLNNSFEIIGNSCIVLVPEPATLSLLALGAFALLRKRK